MDVVRLTDDVRTRMERFRVEHDTQVLTLLLSDLVESTKHQTRLGNIGAAAFVQDHRRIFRRVLVGFDGREVETAGDSFLVVFAAPSEGVKFALHLQAAMRRGREETPDVPHVRIGLHQGQVVVERHADGPKVMDIYGLQVSTAARIAEIASGSQVLCSRSVFDDARAILRGDQLAGLSPLGWCNHGPYRFKGVEDSHEVCEVGESGHAPMTAPHASTKGWPADESPEELGWRPAVGVAVPGTNWVLEERLGREDRAGAVGPHYKGQFGEVWRAWSAAYRDHQVFKFCFKRDRVPALKREARLLKRLRRQRHPNLVEIFDVTEGDRPPYFLEMEYVDGPSLEAWIARDPPLADRLEVVAQVADALDTVHAAGIYHRDIKPSNILLTYREDRTLLAKLTDFGLGSAEDSELLESIYASRTDGVAGTWDYLAPEMRVGGKASAQSDIYSLGVTLYQVVVGDLRRPVGAWERQMPDEVLRDDIRRCLATAPEDRWARAGDLAQALRSHRERVRERRHDRRARRLRVVSAIVGLFAVVMLAFGGFAWRQYRDATRQRRIADRLAETAQKERDEAERQRDLVVEAQRQTDRALYRSNVLLAEASIRDGRHEFARKLLWEAPEGPRSWEWGFLLKRCDGDLVTLKGGFGRIVHLGFSPDGGRVVTITLGRRARVWDAETGDLVAKLDRGVDVDRRAEFSPDGTRLVAVADDGKVGVWDAATGRLLRSLDGPRLPFAVERVAGAVERVAGAVRVRFGDGTTRSLGSVEAAKWTAFAAQLELATQIDHVRLSPDGSRILTVSHSGSAWVRDAASSALHAVLAPWTRGGAELATVSTLADLGRLVRGSPVTAIAFPPDGARVALAAEDGTVSLWDMSSGRFERAFERHDGAVNDVQFSHDGEQLVTAGDDGAARVWDVATGGALRTLRGNVSRLRLARFVGDGGRILTAADTGTVAVWDPAAERRVGRMAGRVVAFSPDATRAVIAADGATRLVDVVGGGVVAELAGPDCPIHGGQFSPDGWRVALACGEGLARIWDTEMLDGLILARGASPAIDRAFFVGTGAHLVAIAGGETLWAWDAASGRLAASLDLRSEAARRKLLPDGAADQPIELRAACATADGLLVVLTAGKEALIWNADRRERVHALSGHAKQVHDASFGSDGLWVVTASEDGTARVWDVASGQSRAALIGHEGGVYRAQFGRDGSRVLTASFDKTVRTWDAATGQCIATLPTFRGGLSHVELSPDGNRVVTIAVSAKSARTWNAATGKPLARLEGHQQALRTARFSADSARVVTASADGTARVWDAATGEELLRLEGPAGSLQGARFSPDGSRVITVDDRAARVWDASSARQLSGFAALAALTAHAAALADAAFCPDGSRVVTLAKDGSVRLWAAVPWRVEGLPGDESLAWEARFRLWRRQRGEERLARTPPSPHARARAAALRERWQQLKARGDAQLRGGQFDAALATFETLLGIASQRSTLVPGDGDARWDLGVSHNRIGLTQLKLRRYDEARTAFESGTPIVAALAGSRPKGTATRREIVSSLDGLGFVCYHTQQGDGARRAYQDAAVVARAWLADDEASAEARQWLWRAQQNLAWAHVQLKRHEDALTAFESACVTAKARAAADPRSDAVRRDLAASAQGLAQSAQGWATQLLDAGEPKQAVDTLERVLRALPDGGGTAALRKQLSAQLAACRAALQPERPPTPAPKKRGPTPTPGI